MFSHLALEPLVLFLVALGAALLIRAAAGSAPEAQPLLARVALCLCVGGVVAVLTLLGCFATGTPIPVQEKLATAALLMAMVGGVLLATVYRSAGDGPPPPDGGPCDPPDDPGGDDAYPWWPGFERELREYERARRDAAGARVRLRP